MATKLFTFIPLMTGGIMLASGLGFMECPDPLCKADGGVGPDKFEWASSASGYPASNILMLVGVCKLLAVIDIYLLNIIPRAACVCVSLMMAAVTYGHLQIPDDVKPPIFFTLVPLLCAASWPEKTPAKAPSGKPKGAGKKPKKI